MKKTLLLLLFVAAGVTFAQERTFSERDLSVSRYIDGTLLLPNEVEQPKLIILIAGSGLTDRNGNSAMAKNNSLKLLAQDLTKNGVATFRYDKRSVKMIKTRDNNVDNILFDDFVSDAKDVVSYFKKSNSFSEIYLAGHSQGSLIGMLAATKDVDGFISMAGPGQSIDGVIVDQIAKQQPGLDQNAEQAFAELREKGSTSSYQPVLESIFNKGVQPFMLSWMKYDPAESLATLDIPVLIVSGDKDIQIPVQEAELLRDAKPEATYMIIPTMNHILKSIEGNDLENQKSYNAPTLPVVMALTDAIITFVNN